MDRWIDEVAAAFGEEPLGAEQVDAILDAARDVAHRVERRLTPVAAFLAGEAAGRARVTGTSQAEAVAQSLARLGELLPPEGAS
jgi:Domain of unknown function (DUF6457)